MGFGQTSLSGVRRGFMPPQLKTKTVYVLGSAVSFSPQNKMQVLELDLDGSACIRCKHHSFMPVCADVRICDKCKKSRNCFHARQSAEWKREHIRHLKQETVALKLEYAKAASELELAEAENQSCKLKVENKKQQYAEYIL